MNEPDSASLTLPPRPESPSATDLRQTLDRIAAALEKRNEQSGKKGGSEGGEQEAGDKGKQDEKNKDDQDRKNGGQDGGDQGKGDGEKGKEGGDDKKKKGKEGEGEEKSHKPSKKTIVIGVLVVLLILAAVLFFWLRSRNKESTDDAYVTGHVHQIASRVAATVEKVAVDDNEHVEAGQLLVRLDPRDYQVALQRAEAARVQAEAQRLQAEAQVIQADAAIAQAEAQVVQQVAQVAQAAANLELAQVNFNRNSGLFQRDLKAVARADVDTSRANLGAQQATLDAAKANLEASKGNLAAMRASAEAARANVRVAEANVATQTAEVANAKLQLSYCEIPAPVGGRVSRKTVEEGQRLSVGQALLSVVPENVWVLANFKETQLEHIQVGQRVDVRVDALPHHSFYGTVDSIQEGTGATFALLPPDNATGNFTKIVQRVPVKIVFDESSVRDFKDKIVPGLSVEPSVDLLSAAPGKPAAKAEKREAKRQKQEEKQNREHEEGKP